MLRHLALIALAGCTTGLALGTAVCHIAWAMSSHEHQYRLTWKNQ